ncbi:MAG: phosphodiester glycosidase family protein [Lachnospiraceae bacterium]|nr:phosphodiester glycosidase family protein [Lachnospiraceae bacterium]
MKFIRILPIILASVLTAFTAFVALDTFVIPRAYSVVTDSPVTEFSEAETEAETSSEAVSADPVITSTSYTDDDIQITLETYYVNDTYVYVADVVVSSSGYIKTALANDTYGRNITDTTSSIASDNSAILAINGDYYGSQEKGYVIRNGVLYRDKAESGQEDLVIYYDGSFEIISEDEISAQELIDAGAWQVLSFGPALLEGGEVSISQNEEVDRAMASNPRTALGIIEDGHYVFVVSDGRTSESEGLSLYELAEFMQTLGVETAYNLDGGGSSTMYFNGQVVNNPTTNGSRIKERSVSDIVYIG